MSGFTDKPASTLEDDRFNITKYINGLTGFILECNTPMTIAIQGDWGSGKTPCRLIAIAISSSSRLESGCSGIPSCPATQ